MAQFAQTNVFGAYYAEIEDKHDGQVQIWNMFGFF